MSVGRASLWGVLSKKAKGFNLFGHIKCANIMLKSANHVANLRIGLYDVNTATDPVAVFQDRDFRE
jgi:hypothetical protein